MLSALFLIAALQGIVPTETCLPDLAKLGLCGTNTGSEIVIDGSRTEPGSSEQRDDTAPVSSGPQGPYTPPPDPFQQCLDEWDDYIRCFHGTEDEEPEDEDPAAAIPAVTISDLVRFAPDPTPLSGEPDDVGVVGLPTNFVAEAEGSTTHGSLLGYPIAVRFTPIGYDFDYGDGSKASVDEPGRSWDDLDLAQFSPTATSHVYETRGVYTARVDVRYTAEVDLGIGWFPVPGDLTTTGSEVSIRIFEAHTALVSHTCSEAPDSPGC